MKLNKEQQKLAQNDAMGHYLIRGIAGSGKTSVGISRIQYLLEKYCDNRDHILFITYNKSLSNYIQYLYEKMKLGNNINVCVKTIDSITSRYFAAYCKEKKYDLKIEWEASQQVFNHAILNVHEMYPKVTWINNDNAKFLRDEIKWMKGCGYTDLEEYQTVDRVGRASSNTEGPSRLVKNCINREAIFKLMMEVDRLLIKEGKVDGGTANILALRHIQKNGVHCAYKHIIIDEAQDLTKIQLEFIRGIQVVSDESSMLFLMDSAQSIYPQAWLGKGNPFTSIGYDMKGKGSHLSKNYRTTTEISKCAYSLLEKEPQIVGDRNFVNPSLFEKHGDYPVYRNFLAQKEQNQYIAKLIKSLIKEGYQLKDIAVVSKINKNLEVLQVEFNAQEIPSVVFKNNKDAKFDANTIKLLTMHSVKGLEFEVVILMDLNNNIIPYLSKNWSKEECEMESISERKLLYVGMTRAKEKLFMYSYGVESQFIKEINPRLLTIQSGCKMKAYYQVDKKDYLGGIKLSYDDYEKHLITQWVLHELMCTYGYPKELLKVDYLVKNECWEQDVPAVVLNGKTNKPYIIVNTLERATPIQEGIEALKLCMSEVEGCYGVATNGINIAFLDRNNTYVKDIPVCQTEILPSTTEKYRFINCNSHEEFLLEKDMSALEVLIHHKVLDSSEITTLTIYADIAAGKPIEMSDAIKGEFSFPISWLGNKKDVFMLQVRGDSMININIENGDYVLIQKTNNVNDHEIAAVAYNGATTLKKIMRMGDSVLLISENSKYEPINISEGEISIMGKLLGVVKAI